MSDTTKQGLLVIAVALLLIAMGLLVLAVALSTGFVNAIFTAAGCLAAIGVVVVIATVTHR